MNFFIKKFLLLVMIICYAPSMVWSVDKQISINSYFKPGSNLLTVTNMLLEELPKRGWKVDIKYTQNCALSRLIYEQSEKPIMVIWGSDRLADETNACALPLVEKEFIHVAYAHSDFMCTARKDITSINDLRDPARPIKIGIRKDALAQVIANDMINKARFNIVPIKYENSGALNKALAAGEVDVIFNSAGPRLVKENKAHCLFVTNDTPVVGARPMKEIADGFERANLKYIFFLMAKGLSPELQELLRQDISNIVAGEKYQNWLSENKFYNFTGHKAGLIATKQSINDQMIQR